MQQIEATENKSSEFREESDTHQVEHDCKFEEDDIEVVLEEIDDHYMSLIGGNLTFMGIKNQASNAVATVYLGLKVMENSREIYLGNLPFGPKWLSDLVYINHLNFYLLEYGGKIYRKDIDKNPRFVFMDLNCRAGEGKNLKYSKLNKRLIVPKDGKNIAVVNLERRQIEVEMKSGPHYPSIEDFIIFGRKEDKIAWITRNGLAYLSSVRYDLKKITSKSVLQVQLIQERGERPSCLAVCDQGKYLVAVL